MWTRQQVKMVLLGILLTVLASLYGAHRYIVYKAVKQAVEETQATMQAEYTKGLLAASEAAREREQVMITSAEKIRKEKDAQIVLLNTRVGNLLSELRQRPQRPPSTPEGSPATSVGKGATGAELYREDAILLAGEAARADRLRLALEQCYRQYDSVRESLR
jgi:hypothetical protein